MERFKTPSASMLILSREKNGKKEILLQKRQNTGYKDGYYDLAASGHVEAKETAKDAMIREAKEELGIKINISDLIFSSIVHKFALNDISPYYNFYFYCEKYEGIPKINEPDKCSELKWVPIDTLPEMLIDDRKQAINNHLQHIYYNEFGFGEE